MNIISVVVFFMIVGWLVERRDIKKAHEVQRLEDKLDELKKMNSPFRNMTSEERNQIRADSFLYDRHKKDRST